jgi:hypothetical protein
MIERAIKNKAALEILYLKPSDEKTRRVIKPGWRMRSDFGGKEVRLVNGAPVPGAE